MRNALLALGVALSGCSHSDPAEFPIGIFGVEDPAAIDSLSAVGFNAFQSYSTDPLRLRELSLEARRHRALFMAGPWQAISSTFTSSAFPEMILYLQDEPDVNGQTLEGLKALEARARAWAPKALTAFVVGDGRRAKDFPGVGDAVMVDWYPVPHLPISSLGDHVGWAAKEAGGRKVWAVLQAMDWRDFPQRNPSIPRIGRFPTIQELRFMSYDAILNGANGLWYFTYTISNSRTIADRPEDLFALRWVAREFSAMRAIVAHGATRPLGPELQATGVSGRIWRANGRDYALLINRTPAHIALPMAVTESGARPLFEKRRKLRELLASNGKGGEVLPMGRALMLESPIRDHGEFDK